MNPKPQPLALLGVDTGGTFTDLVLVAGDAVRTWKLPSTPDDPARAVLAGVHHLCGEQPVMVVHGSTVATNALLEGKGARVALLVTAGFRDLLAIGRQNRPVLYALHPRRGPALVAAADTLEVAERVLADGSIEQPLREAEIERVVAAVRALGCQAVAISLLHAYANPRHEQQLLAALEADGCSVSTSHRILPEFREFERTATTAVNAAVAPVMSRYLGRLQAGLGAARLRIMQSNGGAISAEAAAGEAVRTILSGPAGGMVGAFAAARAAGCERILTFDMGGTSTDVGLCPGTIPTSSETVIAGWPVRVPMIDLHTVGAGGGSIARLDAGGALRVGPQSAGADPGPVCYGRGGTEVTVTDANLYLGRLLPDRFLGGRMPLDVAACRTAVEALAARAGLAPPRLAEGVLEVAEATMAGALRVVSVQRGEDPREFTLLPFGGAGGLHACALAEQLQMRRILIPANPGLLSAVGLVLADVIRDYSRSVLLPAAAGEALAAYFRPLEMRARQEMAAEGVKGDALELQSSLDLRYRGQSFEVNVAWSDDFAAAFHRRHQELYGHCDPLRPLEIVTLRLRAVGPGPAPDLTRGRCPEGAVRAAETRPITFAGRQLPCPVFARDQLPCGGHLAGPALVVEETATHLVAPGWRGEVDARGNLLLEKAVKGES
jgi:N-methylhydantoinase A